MPPSTAAVRLRVYAGEEIAMGPGKAELLEAIREEGSISRAARRLGMSYRRAWLLIDTANRAFARPLVERRRGGPKGGGASLTPLGAEVLAAYREAEREARRAAAKPIARIRRRLKRE